MKHIVRTRLTRQIHLLAPEAMISLKLDRRRKEDVRVTVPWTPVTGTAVAAPTPHLGRGASHAGLTYRAEASRAAWSHYRRQGSG